MSLIDLIDFEFEGSSLINCKSSIYSKFSFLNAQMYVETK